MKILTYLLFAMLMAACVSQQSLSPDRFLQIRAKQPSSVLVQIALQSGNDCNAILDRLPDGFEHPSFPGTYSFCASTSASSSLPFRATLKNKRLKVAFDVESDDIDRCYRAVALAMQGQMSADEVDVLSPCQKIL